MEETLDEELRAHVARRDDTLARVRRVLREELKVALAPDEIDLDAPLFGMGLGLDSVDAVELIVAVESEFGIRIPEGVGGPWALRTVHALVEFVIELEVAIANMRATPVASAAEAGPTGVAGRSPQAGRDADRPLPPDLEALRSRVVLARTGRTHVVRLRGPDAREAALWLVPSRLHLRDAQAQPSLFLDTTGRPIADVTVAADDEDYLLFVDGPSRDRVLDHVRSGLPASLRPEVVDESETHDVVSVHGPWAWELLADVLGSDMTALPYLNFFRIEHGLCLRAGRTGEFGYDVLVERQHAEELVTRFREKGSAYEAVEVAHPTLALAGFESWFFDADHVPPDATPIELQLGWRLDSGHDYLGRAAVDARRAQEGTRRLACVTSASELETGGDVVLGDRVVGTVTRAAYCHARGEHFASVLLDPPLRHGGITQLRAHDRDGYVPLTTVAPPLLDNRSLHVDPRRHTYRARDEVKLGPLARGPLVLPKAFAEAVALASAAKAAGT